MRSVADETDDVEIHAALGICLTFQAGPLELGTEVSFSPVLEEAKQEMAKAEGCSWPEVGACRAWIHLLEQNEHSSIPDDVQTLVHCAAQSQWFPLRALACRALAFYDRRSEALLLSHADHTELTGAALVAAEAHLEAGSFNGPWRPLPPSVPPSLPLFLLEHWRQLLDVEARFALGEDVRAFLPAIQKIVDEESVSSSSPVTYVQHEQARLAARTCAALARIALAQGQTEQALVGLTHTTTIYLPKWERLYLAGLVAWQRGALDEAEAQLENSLAANPFQSRVRVELGMLLASRKPDQALAHLTIMPDTPDAAAGRAAILARSGCIAEARNVLVVLDQEDALLPTRLVWPAAYRERLYRGWMLRVETAERLAEWNTALTYLEHAHRQFSTDLSLLRAHQMWIHAQQAEQLATTDRRAARQLSQQVEQELQTLAARPLTGDAMFYRSLVAATRLPDRAVKDWQALLRQRQWAERAPTVAGPRFLYIGDGLWKAGYTAEAIRAYRRAVEFGADGASARLALIMVRTQGLSAIPAATDLAPHDPLWPLAAALAALAATPPDINAAVKWAEIARERNAPQAYMELVTVLCGLLQDRSQAPQTLAQLLAQRSLGSLPPVVNACLSLLTSTRSAASDVQALLETLGKQWLDVCPVPPEQALQKAVAEIAENEGAEAALALARRAEQDGILLPRETSITLLAACATLAGMQGRFDEAERYLRQAQQLVSAQ
ncbi:MAG: hypothetical protein HYZ50_20105 [Deltaproteobacteria bacterium]|nr:hypothetical protein [Deltaproteobacteria bacterium]